MEFRFSGEILGIKIRKLRESWGLSQASLSEKIGVSFQQVQKYEKGFTRISVERLEMIAVALGVDITAFFDTSEISLTLSDVSTKYLAEKETEQPFLPLNKEEISFIKRLRKIKNKKLRQSLMQQMGGLVQIENQKSHIG